MGPSGGHGVVGCRLLIAVWMIVAATWGAPAVAADRSVDAATDSPVPDRPPRTMANALAADRSTRTDATAEPVPRIEYTTSLTPDRPGEVTVEATVSRLAAVEALAIRVPDEATVVASEGLSTEVTDEPGVYVWRSGGASSPSLTYRLPINETETGPPGPEGDSQMGYVEVDTGSWALLEAPDSDVAYFRERGGDPVETVETEQSVAGPGVAGTDLLFLGPVETRTQTVEGQRITLAVPEAADLRPSPAAVLDTLASTARRTTLGPPDDAVLAVAAPTDGVDFGPGGRQVDDADLWVQDTASLDSPGNLWIHEYTHTRQAYTTTARTDWLDEGMATYYPLARTLRTGRLEHEDYRDGFERVATRSRYANATLAEPSTWRGTGADYLKGAFVLAALDRQIRLGSDGNATLEDAIGRAVERADGGELTQPMFLNAVEAVGGRGSRLVARRYVETDAVPDAWTRSEHVRAFGPLPDVTVRLDGFRVVGPYRNVTTSQLPVLLPGEQVIVRARATNAGGAPGTYETTLDVDGGPIVTRTGRLDGGASTILTWTVPAEGVSLTLTVAGAKRATSIRPPALPRVTELRVPDSIQPGEAGTVTAVVENPTERPAAGRVSLTVGTRTLTERRVQLGSGESTTLTATVRPDEPGTYPVEAGRRSSTVQVRTPTPTPTPPDDSDDEPTTDGPSSVPGDGFGAVAVLLALVTALVLIRGRPTPRSQE